MRPLAQLLPFADFREELRQQSGLVKVPQEMSRLIFMQGGKKFSPHPFSGRVVDQLLFLPIAFTVSSSIFNPRV